MKRQEEHESEPSVLSVESHKLRTSCRSRRTSALLLSILLSILATTTTLVAAQGSPSSESQHARRGHSTTVVKDNLYFIGGQQGAASNSEAVRFVTSLDLETALLTDVPLQPTIYNHVAPRNWTDPIIPLFFGQSQGGAAAPSAQWVDVSSGQPPASNSANITSLPARTEHSVAQVRDQLWILGGRTLTANPTANPAALPDSPMYQHSLQGWSTKLRAQSLPRYGHASIAFGADNSLILTCFGISTSATAAIANVAGGLESECVYLSIPKLAPAPNSNAAMTTIPFVAAQLEWTNPVDAIKNGRVGHTLVTGLPNRRILYMFGGSNAARTEFYQDVYMLNTTQLPLIRITKLPSSFSTVSDKSAIPSGRTEHSAITVGAQSGVMVVYGGYGAQNEMASPAIPYYFNMATNVWIDSATFVKMYIAQQTVIVSHVSVIVIVTVIIGGVALLGGAVGWFVYTGAKKAQQARQEEEARKNGGGSSGEGSPTDLGAGSGNAGSRFQDHKGAGSVYPEASMEDHSMSHGPFKSTSSLIQPDEFGNKHSSSSSSYTPRSKNMKPWISGGNSIKSSGEPHSPDATTLNENGSMHGYVSSSSSSGRQNQQYSLQKTNSSASSVHHRGLQIRNADDSASDSASAAAAGGATGAAVAGQEPYYNTRDLCLDDDDDDSSITVSVASEGSSAFQSSYYSNSSPWNGPVRMSSDLAPPNPRFSRGAIPQAHRQLVGGGGGGAYSWETSSPGGSVSSRDDSETHQRRSVNSMQWVSFDPYELSGARPESFVYEPRSNLTVRNTNSMYSSHRISHLATSVQRNTSITSDGTTTTDDSWSNNFVKTEGRRISTALAARQQRRSMRNSQDSQLSASLAGTYSSSSNGSTGDLSLRHQRGSVSGPSSGAIAKPNVAKLASSSPGQQQRFGPRMVVPGNSSSSGVDMAEMSASGMLLSNQSELDEAAIARLSVGSGLGLDFSGFGTEPYYTQPNNNSHTAGSGASSNPVATGSGTNGYQTRRTSMLNPNYNGKSGTHPGSRRGSTNIILKMPPPPKHGNQQQQQ
ncbi:hypothetical protein BGW38_009176 [Lunasporangiospora selenospora]|uniref:Kelch motif-containing protein n=1 Tax=Lunasporangiospora selenospora TaxID=979761 RepID=A0A9P6FYN4_9FUNG|nr:hypothetical protein BGW38_009176 [Lunasporangiospora selenospora]